MAKKFLICRLIPCLLESPNGEKFHEIHSDLKFPNLRTTQENSTSPIYEIEVKKVEGIFRPVKFTKRDISN